jgi:hypothetical protein
VLDRAKLKVDSDKALKLAVSEPLLKSLKLKASQLWLQHSDEGPVWRVRLWAARLKNPGDADIGEVFISANDGNVVRTHLQINSVD